MTSRTTVQSEAPPSSEQPSRFFALPPETRLMIYDFADPNEIVLPRDGPLLPALDGLVRACKRVRSEILERKLQRVTWCGRMTSKTWRTFKTILVPHIKNLTIEVKFGIHQKAFLPYQFPTWSSLDIGCVREVRDLLVWMYWRNRLPLKAKCPWRLKKLTIVAIFQEPWRWADYDEFADDNAHHTDAPAHAMVDQGIGHWSQEREVKRLKGCGLEIELQRKRVERLCDAVNIEWWPL